MRPTPVDGHTRTETDLYGESTDIRPKGHRLNLRALTDRRRRLWLGIGATGLVLVIIVGILLTRGGQEPVPTPAAAATAHPSTLAGPTEKAAPPRPLGRWVLSAGTSPLEGQSIQGGTEITLTAGTDTLDKVERVKFSLDGDTVLDDRDAPFSVPLGNPSPGKHTLTARVRTDDGSAEVESTFTVTGDGAAPAPTISAAPVPAAVLAALPPVPPPLRTIEATTTDQLTTALANARPGDLIHLADGTYHGTFTANHPATPTAPITLRGTRNAIIDGGDLTSGYAVHLDNADHWHLDGLTIQNSQKGVMADQTTGAVLTNLLVRTIGQEGIHLRNFSTDNFIIGTTVTGTGRKDPGYGEGIYIGTAESNWKRFSDNRPDASDRNQIIGNTISGVTAEAIDIKEATTGGVIRGNHLDGATITGANYADSWIDLKGNNWRVEGNTGTNSPLDGIQTHVVVDGWGTGNIIT
uniref:Ig-like domain-containing protein n=3 Tax=unclassified Frankia TaxID=2632575 RepID=UPI0020240381